MDLMFHVAQLKVYLKHLQKLPMTKSNIDKAK